MTDQTASRRTRADAHLWEFTAVAAITGAIPVPGSSVAIVAENAVMVNVLAGDMGVPISIETVVTSMGSIALFNQLGRTVFIEGARLLGWALGPAICMLGATTAALQTWCLGKLVIAICENGGRVIPRRLAEDVMREARESFDWDEVRRRAWAR